jgi:hypothetical protein
VLAQVLPHAERASGAGDDERAHAVGGAQLGDGGEQRLLHLDGEGVVPGRAVEREHGDGGVLVVALDQDRGGGRRLGHAQHARASNRTIGRIRGAVPLAARSESGSRCI